MIRERGPGLHWWVQEDLSQEVTVKLRYKGHSWVLDLYTHRRTESDCASTSHKLSYLLFLDADGEAEWESEGKNGPRKRAGGPVAGRLWAKL